MSDALIIRGGRILDPAANRDEVGDLYVAGGVVVDRPPARARNVDAAGCLVAPGFLDLHVHLREPGGEENETIASGSRAAARGGFTTIVAMPNTKPPHDTPETVALVKRRGEEEGFARVLPSGTITAGRQGRELANLAALAGAGAIAFTDDGSTVQDDALMRRAMDVARDLNRVIMDHAQDSAIERQGGVMHEGGFSRKFGLPGIPSLAEEKIVRRDIDLAEATGCAVHIQHVASKEGAALIREARRRGLRVTGELTPHHLTLCDADIDPANANYKMNPPLRSREDREALQEAVIDGTLSCFATDHAPHSAARKARGFLKAPFGIVGLETAVGLTYTALVATRLMDLATWVHRWTLEPARILGLPTPTLAPGAPADVVVIDTATPWIVDPNALVTKSHNTPFGGWRLHGRPTATLCGGRMTWPGRDTAAETDRR